MKSLHALVVGLCLTGIALADEPAFWARTPPESPLRAIGPETPSWPNRLSIEYQGRATLRAKYRFVYDEEDGFEQNPHLFLLPDRESLSQFPYLTRWVFESDDASRKVLRTDTAEKIWVTNVADAAIALLGKPLAAEVMAGKHAKIVGEAVVVIEGFSAGYECDSPSFGTLFVEVKNEVSAPSVAARGTSGC
jgi:hypothetical protein